MRNTFNMSESKGNAPNLGSVLHDSDTSRVYEMLGKERAWPKNPLSHILINTKNVSKLALKEFLKGVIGKRDYEGMMFLLIFTK